MGQDSFLSMIYERLHLMRDLLSDDGSILLHCDHRLNSQIRIVMEEIFSPEGYKTEVIWKRTAAGKTVSKNLPKNTDNILWFTKSKNFTFNGFFGELTKENKKVFSKNDNDGRGFYRTQPLVKPSNPGPLTTYDYIDNNGRLWKCPKTGWRINQERMKKLENDNRLLFTSVISEKYYLNERMEIGRQLSNLWDDIPGNTIKFSSENTDYPTQKPEKLLKRIISSLSNEGDIVCDFFVGSGTTSSVAEKLNRKWICSDLGKFSIHTTRKRMIGVQREMKKEGKDYRPFELLNLGKYQREHFIFDGKDERDEIKKKRKQQQEKQFEELILTAYKSEKIDGFKTFQGKKNFRMVSIGPINQPVSRLHIEEVIKECLENRITKVDILGFEYEMGLFPTIQEEASQKGIDLQYKQIPNEIFDKRAVQRGEVKFYDVSYIEVKPIIKGNTLSIELLDFATFYNLDNSERIEEKLKNGKNEVVVSDGNIIKISKDKNGIISKEVLTKKWSDWVDYWSVDFDFENRKELIRVQSEESDEWNELWTGDYIFDNEWQSFRTKENRELELITSPKEITSQRTKVAIKVVDIFGNDTMKIIDVKLK